MATLFPLPSAKSSSIPTAADFEPDEQWKSRLKVDIENGLRSMVDEAKQKLNDALKRALLTSVERDRLTDEYLSIMKNIRNLAEEQFRIALECERQERRWAAGQGLDQESSDSVIKEQQAILNNIERERKDKAVQPSSSSSRPIAVPSNKRPSALETTYRYFERPKPSPTELDKMPRSARPATDAQDSIRRGSPRPKAKIPTGQLPEFWLPSVTPEQAIKISHTFVMERRGSTAGTTFSYRAPSVPDIPFSSELHDVPTSAMERERDRARASVASTPQRLDEHYPPPLSAVAPISSSAIPYPRPSDNPISTVPIAYSRPSDSPISTTPIRYTRSSDGSRPHAPPPSASRPVATKKSFTFDDRGFESSPSPKGWTGPSRSPYESRYETSRSPQTPEEVPRNWQSSNLRARPSSQDMRYGYSAGESGYYPARPVHTHQEVSEGEYDVDLDDAEWREYDERQIRQREHSFSLRRREEEVARREEELRRREEDARREEEAKLKEDELRRKEEETKRNEEETRRKDDEIRRKEVEATRRQEEADRKELEIRIKEEEARRKEEETKRKEDEIKRKEMNARKKEEEVRKKEAQAKKRAEDLQRQEEEVARRSDEEEKRVSLDFLQKSLEAKRKEDEVRRKDEEVRLKEEAAHAKEEETRRKEAELAQREEELLRREAEAVQQQESRKREEEIRHQHVEAQAKKRAEDLRRQEEEVAVTRDILRMSEESKHREDEVRRKEEARLKEEAAHAKEEIQRKEEELARREETLTQREETFAQREEALAQREEELGSPEDLTNELQGRSPYPITSGGFGDIWKCDLVKPSETIQVAVKTIRAFESDNEELTRKNAKRVRRELKVWGRLKHHSILPLWGVANDFGPHPAMICPWADNGALTGFLERQQDKMSSEDKFSLLNDIALGLQYLHSKSVVHGDLTGSNVLIYGNGRACLADFGLSTIVLEFIGTSYFTSSIRGNVRWVAAELFDAPEGNEALLSTECDIYSFGSIILQVLTCKVPYYNVKKDIAVLGQVIRGKKPEPPKETQISPGHWEFIQRCWLPRASRPLVGEIVAFVACERQTLSSYKVV